MPEVRAALIAEAVQVCVCVLVCLHGHHKCYTFDTCDHLGCYYTTHAVSLNSFCDRLFLLKGKKLASKPYLASVSSYVYLCVNYASGRKMAYT